MQKGKKVNLKTLNPITHIGNWMEGLTKEKDTSQAVAPAPNSQPETEQENTSQAIAPANNQTTVLPETEQEGAPETTIVTGTFVPSGTTRSAMTTSTQTHMDHLRQVVESFDEDKQGPLEWAVRQFFTTLSYILPVLVALVVGTSIGDAFSGPFTLASSWSIYSHVISIGLELMLPALGLSATIAFKRSLRDKSQVAMFIILALLFVGLAIGNSFAQIFLIEGHVKLKADDIPGQASMIFRSFGPLIIDIAATIYLSVASAKNLQKYLADMRQKQVAIKDVNSVNNAIDEENLKAAIDREMMLSDMESKKNRANFWNEHERLTQQAMLEQNRQKLIGSGDSEGRGRYGGW